jgi:hypothetical protein
MALYILTSERTQLLLLPFEEILIYLATVPSKVFAAEEPLQPILKTKFKGLHVRFHLERLQRDYEAMHGSVCK